MGLSGKFVLWYGVVFGILDWVSDIIYVLSKQAQNEDGEISSAMLNACVAFIVLQPVFYLFIHTVYMASHSEINTFKDRVILVGLSPVYALL